MVGLEETVRVPARDGSPLAASVFPAAGPVDRVLLIVPATGVRRRLYRRLAAFLAERGLTVVTWDWRGTGDSRPASLRGFEATMRGWAEEDLAGVVDWARERWRGLPLVGVGHSFGGQAFGLTPAGWAFRRIVLITSQIGYYGHWPVHIRPLHLALWKMAVPLLTAIFGYFPSRSLGFGEDLPYGVARQWARWCSRERFFGHDTDHAAIQVPILSIGFSDDGIATRAAVEALLRRYRSAAITRRFLDPADVGRDKVGHFGFFRLEGSPLWEEVAGFLSPGGRSAVEEFADGRRDVVE